MAYGSFNAGPGKAPDEDVVRTNQIGVPGGIATLDADGHLTESQRPAVDAFYYSGKYTLTVRTVSSGGLYLPIVAEQTAQAVFDKAAELGITLSEYKVEEFSEGNSSKVENMILWKSADGVTGTYTDDTGSSPYIETDVTVERLAEIVK